MPSCPSDPQSTIIGDCGFGGFFVILTHAVLYHPAAMASGSGLLENVIENFAGYGLQEGGCILSRKKYCSWCSILADFYVPNKIQPVCTPSGSDAEDMLYNSIRRQRERQRAWPQGQREPLRQSEHLECRQSTSCRRPATSLFLSLILREFSFLGRFSILGASCRFSAIFVKARRTAHPTSICFPM